jgi:hypothetical protein
MSLGRTILPRIAVVALLASCLVAVVPGPANAGQLTLRKCTSDTNDDILRGDGQRKLSVCSRGWVNGNPASTRGVVELHTYALVQGIWQDSRSQSISLQLARVERLDPRDFWVTEIAYGQERGGNCRVNGSGGSVGCSVANVTAVDF